MTGTEQADADRAAILVAITARPAPVGRVCECGCGGSPKGKRSRFLPGHDMKSGGHKARAGNPERKAAKAEKWRRTRGVHAK